MPSTALKLSLPEVMATLEGLGSDQARKTLRRHGITGDLFGVRYGDQYALAKKIKMDHSLALGLWSTGNHDARVLATLIADPNQAIETAPRWVEEATGHVIVGDVASYAAKGPGARDLAELWRNDPHEFRALFSWQLLGILTAKPDAGEQQEHWRGVLDQIEAEIHGRPNRVRLAMVTALCGIGTINLALKELALASAKRIGHVEIDHGDTACKTPDPLTMIEKAFAHRHRSSPSQRPKAT